MRNRPVAKRRRLFNHRLDRGDELRIDLRRRFDRFVVNRTARHAKPAAQLGNRDGDAFGLQSLADHRGRPVSITSRPRPAGTAIFSRAQLQHGLAIRLLKILELTLVLLAHVLGIGALRVLHAPLAVIDPLLDLRGDRSYWRLASATVVLPWMMSSTSALLRLAVQRLMSSSIFVLIVNSVNYDVSRFSLGQYRTGYSAPQGRDEGTEHGDQGRHALDDCRRPGAKLWPTSMSQARWNQPICVAARITCRPE